MKIWRAFRIAAQPTVRCWGARSLLAGVILGVSACASSPPQPRVVSAPTPEVPAEPSKPTETINTAAEVSAESVAIDDLVRALVQYRDPIATTLQAGPDMSSEDNADLLAALAEQGYGLQLVDADQGANLLLYTNEDLDTSLDSTSRHTLQVGQLTLSREYATIRQATRPIGPLMVAGSRRRISIDDSRFGTDVTNDGRISRIEFTIAEGVDPDSTPRISLLQLPLNPTGKDAQISTTTSGLEVSNVYFGGNNFGSLLDDYSRVIAASVIFPNDSMRLGNSGRLKIEVFLDGFDEESDLIRVVGCSNGKTNLAIGNEGLALGRAERVTQELLARGVTRSHILDEGCWGPQPIGQRFPSRGVVLELYRES